MVIPGNPTANLPFAEEEARTIGNLLQVSPVIGQCATRTAVVSRLLHAPIGHFACHGTTDGRSLQLAPEENQTR